MGSDVATFQLFCSHCDGKPNCTVDGLAVRVVGSVTGVEQPPTHTMVCPKFIKWQADQRSPEGEGEPQ